MKMADDTPPEMDTVGSASFYQADLFVNDTYDPARNQTVDIPALMLEQSPFLVSLNGYASPVLVLITIVTNTLVCLVLLQSKMRTPTNVLLVAIATSDMLTGVWPLPCFVYFYTLGNYRDWVPHSWCFAYYYLTEYLPTIFHTASIWLTVALAIQRYIYVCHALRARELCTIPNFVKVIFGVYVAAFVSQASRFFESRYMAVELASIVHPDETVSGCVTQLVHFVQENTNAYFNVYYWFRVIFIHLVPCTSLVVLNGLLIDAMKTATRRREQLLKQNRRSECRRLAESNCTTLMLVHVVGVFLLVEFPLAILFIVLIIQNTFDLSLISKSSGQIATWFINLFILLSYPINFFIYCSMSRQFRATFKEMFCIGQKPSDVEQTRYVSMMTTKSPKMAEETCL